MCVIERHASRVFSLLTVVAINCIARLCTGAGDKIAEYTNRTLDSTPFMTLMRVDNRLENYMFNDKGDIWAVDCTVLIVGQKFALEDVQILP
jgi:hypothetical protein